LVVEDAQGRARILLGAPFPEAKERTRQDARTTSILFLDENGHDRLTLGEELEPQIGGKVPVGIHRIASGFGVVIHDGSGDERGAYGWLSNGRALITLDRPGTEAFAAMVNDRTGETKLSFGFPPEVAHDASAIEIGTKGTKSFLRFDSKSGKSAAVFSTEDGGNPSFMTFDRQGTQQIEHLESTPCAQLKHRSIQGNAEALEHFGPAVGPRLVISTHRANLTQSGRRISQSRIYLYDDTGGLREPE
jgi:hypothetical protein